MAKTTTPRGIRNNNPLNIRKTDIQWLGKVSSNDDDAFERFSSMIYGIRAALVNIRTHISHDKAKGIVTTVQSEIYRWAPPSENNTSAYLRQVCQLAVLKADASLQRNDKSTLCRLAKAMSKVETGWSLDMQLFYDAWDML